MTETKKRKLLLVLFVLLFTVFLGLSNYFQKYAENNLSNVSARYNTASITPRNVALAVDNQEKVASGDVPDITLWNRLQKEDITGKVTGNSVKVNIIEANGDMSQIIPMTFMEGNYTYIGDENGCVLDEKTAYELFGTTKAVNDIVNWKDKEYVVRGVVKARDTMMLLQLPGEDHPYSNVEAVYLNNQKKSVIDNQGQLLEDFLVQNGMPEPDGMFDGNEMAWLLGIICHLPLWIIGIQIILLLIKRTCELKKSIIMCVTFSALTLLISLTVIKVTEFNIHIPSQYIPTKWSDFDFYVDTVKRIQEEMVKNHNCMSMPKDIIRSSVKSKCILYSVIDMLLLVLFNMEPLITKS